MNSSVALTIALVTMAFAQQVSAQPADPVDVLLQQDVRLATIAERMLGANRALCRRTMPLTGMVLHSRDQYGTKVALGDAFANGDIAVAAVVPGSAAAAAIQPDDALAAIGPVRSNALPAQDDAKLRDRAFAALAEQPAPGPLALAIVHDGTERAVTLDVAAGCRALVEIRSRNELKARSDGRVIQVNYGLAARATDDELAAVFAHELGHVVLEHRRRLEAAGVEKGFFGEFGRNQRLNREVEVEADRISVHLLANAGYDPAVAPAFWRSKLGRSTDSGIFRSAVYLSPEARAELMEGEIAEHLAGHQGPSMPAHLLALRDTPFK